MSISSSFKKLFPGLVERNRYIWATDILLLSVIGGIFLYGFRVPIYNELSAFDLIPHDEHFTELYFDAYPASRTTQANDGKAVTFSFSVHNEEGAAMAYPYRVYAKAQTGEMYLIASSTMYLGNAESITVPETYVPERSVTVSRVVVELTQLHQHIDFLLGQ